MDKTRSKIVQKRQAQKKGQGLSLTKTNYLFFGVAMLVLLLGYFSLAQGPADSFWSLTLAPILLVTGYCVLIPLAIFWRPRKQDQNQTAT